ncbi:DUF4397 domain-containing protein [Hymenobacter monticola]|uniref:DUF4397 domain-containing protein n=1 Tax=Hymenobacter monticola TaxID=1705399 RepID=A0ABY4BB84_9BACT|nr:DUF4397 domain-containing protein [Hymenobacter monticola]UOE34936.1 DUF4397 domain-containing protein [Hymenobacter monticola]
MQTFVLSRALRALVPATMLLAACGKSDTPAPTPVPDTGKVTFSNAAVAANAQITFFGNDQQLSQLNYGQSAGYSNVNAGNATIRANNGSQVVATQTLAVAKDQSYSVFAYSPNNTLGSLALLSVPDNLAAPVAGEAKIRIVHLGLNAPSPVRLAGPSVSPPTPGTPLTGDVPFGAASDFVRLAPGPLNLTIIGGTPATQQLAVGDGSGSGTGSKTYEAGKIYTVVVRGLVPTTGQTVPAAQQLQAVVIQNN